MGKDCSFCGFCSPFSPNIYLKEIIRYALNPLSTFLSVTSGSIIPATRSFLQQPAYKCLITVSVGNYIFFDRQRN